MFYKTVWKKQILKSDIATAQLKATESKTKASMIFVITLPETHSSSLKILLINGVYWGYNPLILTFDPNFLGHPSKKLSIPKDKPNRASHLLTIDPNHWSDHFLSGTCYQWSKVWVQSDERARLQQLQQRETSGAVVDASLGQKMKLDFEAPGGDFVEVIDVATGPDRFGFQLFQRFFSGWLRSLRLANPDWWPSGFFFFFAMSVLGSRIPQKSKCMCKFSNRWTTGKL